MNVCAGAPYGGCGLDFSTVPAFDAHRVGTFDYTFTEGVKHEPPSFDGRRCLSEEELNDAGWRSDRWGRWSLPAALEPHLIERVTL